MASAPRIEPGIEDALIVVDVQNDFCPGGRLAVQKGDEVVPLVNALAKRFENVVLTQDWHPPGHRSFATSHPGSKPFDSVKLAYGEDRKSTRLNSSHITISYAVFCLKKK